MGVLFLGQPNFEVQNREQMDCGKELMMPWSYGEKERMMERGIRKAYGLSPLQLNWLNAPVWVEISHLVDHALNNQCLHGFLQGIR